MKQKTKRVLMTALAFILVIAISVGGTMAYLTARTQTLDNVFTVGNISIELYESRLDRENGWFGDVGDMAGAASYCQWKGGSSSALAVKDLTADNQSDSPYATLQAMGFTDEQIIEDSKNYQDYLGNGKLMPGGSDFSKFAYVKNTGEEPAYIRIHMYVPFEMAYLFVADVVWNMYMTDAGPNWRPNAYIQNGVGSVADDRATRMYPAVKDVEFAVNSLDIFTAVGEELGGVYDGINELVNKGYLVQVPITDKDGNPKTAYYLDIVSTRIKPLEPGEMTYWGRGYNFMIPESSGNIYESMKDMDNYEQLVNYGLINPGYPLTIKVFAEAIQAEGFETMEAAWEAFDAQQN